MSEIRCLSDLPPETSAALLDELRAKLIHEKRSIAAKKGAKKRWKNWNGGFKKARKRRQKPPHVETPPVQAVPVIPEPSPTGPEVVPGAVRLVY